jgi:putative hemolysin
MNGGFIKTFDILTPYAIALQSDRCSDINFFSLVLGVVAQRIGMNHPVAIAKAVALPMKMVSIITAPFIWLLTHATEFC